MEKVILSFVGYPASGKDTAALYLSEKYGFVHVSTGDIIRAYIKENNLGEPTRELCQKAGIELRNKYGNGYLVSEALRRNQNADRVVISGIRTVGEAEEIKKHNGKIVIVDASQEIRFKRSQARGLVRDNTTFEAFKAIEDHEKENPDPAAQNIHPVMLLADMKILNNTDREGLSVQVDDLISNLVQADKK